MRRLIIRLSIVSGVFLACNNSQEAQEQTVDPSGLSTNAREWTLVADSAELRKPLNRFLKLKSGTVILSRTSESGSDKAFDECIISFHVVGKVDVKKDKKKLEEVRKDLPDRFEALTNEKIAGGLYRHYTLLDMILLDSLGQEIPNVIMRSVEIDSIGNLAKGGHISCKFSTDGSDEPLKRITAGRPKYFRIRLSDEGTGLSKYFADYIRSTKQ